MIPLDQGHCFYEVRRGKGGLLCLLRDDYVRSVRLGTVITSYKENRPILSCLILLYFYFDHGLPLLDGEGYPVVGDL